MTIDEQLKRIEENTPKVYEAGRNSLKNDVANALKGSAISEAVVITDMSPVEHDIKVNVKSKNLLKITGCQRWSAEDTNISWSFNGEGVEINGTPQDLYVLRLSINELNLPNGDYTLSKTLDSVSTVIFLTNGKSYNSKFTVADDVTLDFIQLRVAAGTTVSGTVNLQLEKGATATAWTPYVADIEAVKVIAQGKNLIPFPYIETKKTINGVTFTVNDDRSITVNGTATADTWFIFSRANPKKGTYFLSGCPSGGSNTTYYLDLKGYDFDTGKGRKFSISKSWSNDYRIGIMAGYTANNLVFKPMLEYGDTATEYEHYKEPIEYSAGEAIKPIYPTTTITTDTVGALVEVEYNRDINKAFAELYQAIISLGGNV